MRILLLALAALACNGDQASDGADSAADAPAAEAVPFSDCDPIQPDACGYPFPSRFYMVEDAATPTGWRINLGPTTLPKNVRGIQPDPTFWNERDGWTVAGPLMAHLPTATVTGVPGHDAIADSLLDDSPTLLIDLDTGERVAHWSERDVRLGDTEDSVFLVRPAAPLEFGHHYVVGLRNIVDASGAVVPSPEGFAALRDGVETGDPDLDQRLPWYDEQIFPALEAEGWSRDEVVLAWDFVTGSREGITGPAVAARDQALAAIEGGVAYTIDEIDEAPNAHTAFRVHGTMTAPLLTDKDGPGAVLTRGDDGLPYVNGTTEVPFTVVVPNSLVDAARPGALVQYGHGLLGGQGEVEGGYLAEMADRYGWVVFAVDWTGMKSADAVMIAVTIQNEIGRIATVPERSIQGFVEFETAMTMMRRDMLTEPALMAPHPDTGELVSLIDPDRSFYYGNSQGGIYGASYTGLATQVQRSVLGVPGAPYSLLLTRSSGFNDFLEIFRINWSDQKDLSLWIGLVQTLWDSAEPSGYLTSTTADPLPGTPEKDVLLQVAMADGQVADIGAHYMARAYGAPLIEEPARVPWGLETVASGHVGSAIVEFDYGIEIPVENLPPAGPDPHEWPRRDRAGQDQIDHFFRTGEVVHFCEGVCGDLSRGAE